MDVVVLVVVILGFGWAFYSVRSEGKKTRAAVEALAAHLDEMNAREADQRVFALEERT